MGTPYLGELRMFPFNFAPKGWAMCNGQTLPIAQNQALFALLGTTYGGNGQTTFLLPNLQGRTPIHYGSGYVLGQAAGESNHTLLSSEMPQHTHTPIASASGANTGVPTNNFWANGNQPAYDPSPNGLLVPTSIGLQGGSQPHNNTPPYLTLVFCIALVGIFPSQS